MTDTDPLVAFIEARISEEEMTALAAPRGPWTWEALGTSGYPQRVTNSSATLIAECFENPDHPATCADHIARQDPAATLARCAALRALVFWAQRPSSTDDHDEGMASLTKEEALRHVAAIWRDHPDWRDEWDVSS